MPPKRPKGIVKSGNAGNSSKASKVPPPAVENMGERKHLFPMGYKYPLTILNERCQDNGWEKPNVQTYQGTNGWSFTVTLTRIKQKTGEKESVRMEPRPPYNRPSAIEARHWGATYALYRFCNGMRLQLVLPPGPRDYWNELTAEHKSVPQHLQWMYAPDPFAFKKELRDRKATSAHIQDASGLSERRNNNETLMMKKDIPEVKMATDIREAVEDIVKKGLSMYPEATDVHTNQLSEDDVRNTSRQLGTLGFSSAQIQIAVSFLAQPSAISANLLATVTPLEAAIEYLVLHVPECDLPLRFLPSRNSSDPFITSLHSGTDNLKRRWIEEKATKEAGWPAKIVRECMSDERLLNNWDRLINALCKRLIGEGYDEALEPAAIPTVPYAIEPAELEAYNAVFVTNSELVMPLFSAPIKLHVFISADPRLAYPKPGFIPVYLSSTTVPAYIRLHLLSRLLIGSRSHTFLDADEGFCLGAMRLLEEEWSKIETDGRPDISSVLQHVLPQRNFTISNVPEPELIVEFGGQRRKRSKLNDNRTSKQIREDFLALCQSEKYTSLLSTRQKLPVFKFRSLFLEELKFHRVVIVIGETGCGKTTQLPQFVLDSLILSEKGLEAYIIVTQPRRIAAISVSNRVSAERLHDGSVGYAIRGETKVTGKTKLLFCTTGVALRRIASGDGLQNISHILVDEVHERAVDSDMLLLGSKELLRVNPHLRVVLMSATINHEKFAKYFNDAPVLEIPGFSYPIVDFYLEDVETLIHSRVPSDAQEKGNKLTEITEEVHISRGGNSTRRSRARHIDYQVIANTVQHIMKTAETRGGVLIFLPGVQEIRRCINAIRSVVSDESAEILPLHANLTSDEQSKVFKQTFKWKIIAATNVAETSITIDDVVYVIDTGKVKEVQYDAQLGLSKLGETWISRAAAKQRRGRAGRTQPGTCYKLYTREDEAMMEDFTKPEIQRVPLENVVLQAKSMHENEDVKSLLSRAIDPPADATFDRAWSTLRELGAVESTGETTPLGQYISGLPMDVKLAKMLILGTLFQCLDPILTVVACLSSKPLFVSPTEKREEANQARRRFLAAGSDLLTDVKAYDECMRLRSQDKRPSAISRYCEENFISSTALQAVTSLRHEFFSYLTDLGFIPLHYETSSAELNSNSHNTNLVKAVIMGGLWPHVARVRVRRGAQKFDQVQSGTVAREIKACDYVLHDVKDGRVFLHPGSVLFSSTSWKCDFLVYFYKYQSDKVYLRDATQLPLYSLLLMGGPVTIDHVKGGLTVASNESRIQLKAWPRIGVLVNQLRRLLDVQLSTCFKNGIPLSNLENREILKAFKLLITHDGMSESI
ncbi:hypothetical protein AX17_000627 [Amanita inopinata Kibby_2008]|nr:hypothetical protein AX17_000627 [Amanita inopinata Kibby_2008]